MKLRVLRCVVCGSKGDETGCSNANCDLFPMLLRPSKWNAYNSLIRTARRTSGEHVDGSLHAAVRRFDKAFGVKEKT